jgi:hypothetical protein
MTANYPSDAELKRVKTWEPADFDGLMEYVAEIWAYPEYIRQEGDKWHVSTGGWSGNEDIIRAMSRNYIWWALHWEQSRRGGDYIFSGREIKTGGTS